MIRRDETGHIIPVKVEGNSIQRRDIWVIHSGQDPNFSEKSLIDDSRYKLRELEHEDGIVLYA